jgi:putative membrane protein
LNGGAGYLSAGLYKVGIGPTSEDLCAAILVSLIGCVNGRYKGSFLAAIANLVATSLTTELRCDLVLRWLWSGTKRDPACWRTDIETHEVIVMKNPLLLAAVAVALISTSAVAQSVGEKTGVNSTLGIAPKTEDFIKEAAMSDMLEVEAAKVAQQKGNAADKKFADQMVTDHTKTSTELKGMVSGEMKAAIPSSLDDSSQKKLVKLRDAKPDDFAGEYDPMQVSAHKDAVSLFERYAKGGEDPKLKEWAGKTLPALQHHLEMAQDLDKNRK